MKIQLANSSEQSQTFIGLVNELKVDADGWAMIAPYGDYPNTAVIAHPSGRLEKFPAVQRLDELAVKAMIETFNASWGGAKRYLAGAPIYDGHPDMPGAGDRYPDKSTKGVIFELAARPDGFYGRPVFTNDGMKLVESGQRRCFSARWTAQDHGMENGKRVLIPSVFLSVGLTNQPNLPVRHLMNAEWQLEDDPTATKQHTETAMKKTIVDWLNALGFSLANDATDEQVGEQLKKVGEKVKGAATLANEKDTATTQLETERQATKAAKDLVTSRDTELANVRGELSAERKAHIDAVLDLAIKEGRITAAQRPEWAGKLEANFANDAAAIRKLTPAMHTSSRTGKLGERKTEMANVQDRSEQVTNLVNEEMKRNGGDYDRAFSTIRRTNATLFGAMIEPNLQGA